MGQFCAIRSTPADPKYQLATLYLDIAVQYVVVARMNLPDLPDQFGTSSLVGLSEYVPALYLTVDLFMADDPDISDEKNDAVLPPSACFHPRPWS